MPLELTRLYSEPTKRVFCPQRNINNLIDSMARKIFKYFRVPKILGLRASRIFEWWGVLKLESGNLSYIQKLLLLKKMTLFATRAILRPPDPKKVKERYRTCLKCVVFSWQKKQCRDGEGNGCGCYTPYLVASSREPCWMRKRGNGGGWE